MMVQKNIAGNLREILQGAGFSEVEIENTLSALSNRKNQSNPEPSEQPIRPTYTEEERLKVYEELNRAIFGAEDVLRRMRPINPIFIWATNTERLSFRKICNAWRIVYCDDNTRIEDDWKPVVNAPIETRLRLSQFIPRLRESILLSKDEFVEEVKIAIQSLNDFAVENF